ncbi:RNase adapter RapZ [Vibrio metschnikovii]
MRLIVVSGQSGAGKSVALRVLEDLGYYCVDNLPVSLLDAFIQSVQDSKQNVAVSIDIRNLPKEPSLVEDVLDQLKKIMMSVYSFWTPVKRHCSNYYSETRRIHPLSLQDDKPTLAQAIEREKCLLAPLKEQADLLLEQQQSIFA